MRFFLTHLLRIRREWIPYLILIVSLLVTFGATFYYIQSSARTDKLRFFNIVTHTNDTIRDKLNTYTALVRSGAGLFAANDSVSREEFTAFADRVQIFRNYPDILGIGYVERVPEGELPAVIQRVHESGDLSFHVYPDNKKSEYDLVRYFEPLLESTKVILGYDMSTNPARKTAMDQARDSGQPTLSEKVTLIQMEGDGAKDGFILYTPLYREGNMPATINERRDSLQGFIYIPFHTDRFFQDITNGRSDSPLLYKVYVGKETSDKNLLYDSTKFTKNKNEFTNADLTKSSTVAFGGNIWTIRFANTDTFARTAELNLILLLLGSGIAGSFFLFYISRLQYLALVKAEKSENKLRQSKERYRRLIASTKVVPWEADFESGGMSYVGHQAKYLLGYPVKHWFKEGFWEQNIHPEDREKIVKANETLPKKKQEYELHYRMVKKNGKIVWVHDIVKVVQLANGKKLLAGIIIDVTEREMLVKQKDDFISIATHELKTPVTSIKAYAQVLHRQFKIDGKVTQASYVSKMVVQLDKLISLIGDLLDVTKIEGGRLQFHEELFDSNELITEIIEEVQRTSDIHQIVPKLQKTQLLWGDRDRIGQVITNFLTNAIKYSPNSNKILVRTKIENAMFICSVRDYGIGIPSENQDKIFDRFFRVKGPNEDAFPGLGLGLYISAEIIKRHKGKIWVKSIHGRGSVFYFSLPLHKSKSKPK